MNNFLKCSNIENEQIKFYSELINKGDIVFDVGANVGSRTKLFINLGADVISYEPQPELANYLCSYLKSCRRCKIFQMGLSNKEGETILHTSEAHVLSSMSTRWINATKQSGRFKDFEWNDSITVQVSTLDKEIEKNGTPSFIKIDVEGHELEVLQGLTKTIKSISFEFTAEEIDITIKCIKRLSMLNDYKFNFCIGENFNYESRKWLMSKLIIVELSDFVKKNQNCWGDVYATLS